jgi:hypothetical protein
MEERGGRQWSPVLLPVAIAALFALFGHPLRAATVAAFALLAALLIFLGVPVARKVEQAAKAIGHALSTVAGVVVFLLVIGPAWTWSKLTRRDPFLRNRAGTGWADHSAAAPTNASLGSATPLTVGRRSLLGRLTWSVGCVILLLAANYGLGWAYDELKPLPEGAASSTDIGATQTDALPGSDGATTTVPPAPMSSVKYDPRAELPAMAAYPWRERYFQDLQRGPSMYWPYTQYRPLPFTSPYINVDGWSRRTYRTSGSAKGRPEVWMFGGSTAWGEGQRDEYTIASYLARFAEEAGTPIEIRNYGQRGWTHFQDMVLYEQLLALEGTPDLAVFYDGVNELNTQSLVPEAVPTHYDVLRETEKADGKTFATRFGETPKLGTLIDDLRIAYSEHSLIHKIARYASEPAGASPHEQAAPAVGQHRKATRGTGEAQQDQADDDVVRGSEFTLTEQDGTDAGQVYMRAQKLTHALSDQYDVPTLFYWQPFIRLNAPDAAARAQIKPPTIDISELLLDHQDVYIDGAHTNEEGARIVADRLWEDLGPEVETWYEENP